MTEIERMRRLTLNSLLLSYEMEVIALYDYQRKDASPDDFLGMDLDGSVAKRKAVIEHIREAILEYAKPS